MVIDRQYVFLRYTLFAMPYALRSLCYVLAPR